MRDGATATLRLKKPDGGMLAVAVSNLIVGGWVGRDTDALQHHIDELKAIGVTPPNETPLFYRNAVSVLMQDDAIQVVGPDASGEVEAVPISTDGRSTRGHAPPGGNDGTYANDAQPSGSVMMLGTFATIGGIRPASRFAMEIEDPVRGATISHTYDIHSPPLVS